VRLRQGDFDREQVYAEDPLAVAAEFAAAGAEWIHVVDLDGARAGGRRQVSTIEAIVASLAGAGPRLQVAGGLRSAEAIADVLGAGVERVVVGTVALRDPDLVAALIGRHGPDRIAVALDVRDGLAVGHGWRDDAPGVAVEVALEELFDAGVRTFEVTAIDRDGLLGNPDLELYRRLIALDRGAIIASAGIATIADLLAVRDLGCAGAIVGRAIYEGRLTVASALNGLATPSQPD